MQYPPRFQIKRNFDIVADQQFDLKGGPNHLNFAGHPLAGIKADMDHARRTTGTENHGRRRAGTECALFDDRRREDEISLGLAQGRILDQTIGVMTGQAKETTLDPNRNVQFMRTTLGDGPGVIQVVGKIFHVGQTILEKLTVS